MQKSVTTPLGTEIVAKVIFQLSLFVTAFIATFVIGWYLDPIVTSSALAPVGVEGSGWPLAFTASYWDDMGPKSYGAQTFNLEVFVVDILLIYAIIRLAIFMLMRSLTPIVQRYDSHGYVKRYSPYAVLTIVGLIIIYYALLLYTERRTVISGVPVDSALPVLNMTPKTMVSSGGAFPDEAGHYSVEIPRDWRITQEVGEASESEIRLLSRLEAESNDWHIETPDSIDASTHIVSGAKLEVYVFNRDIGHAPSRIGMVNVFFQSKSIKLRGAVRSMEVYKEYGELKEALILEFPIEHDGNFYTFRFAYNPKTYPEGEEVFMRMLESVKFTK